MTNDSKTQTAFLPEFVNFLLCHFHVTFPTVLPVVVLYGDVFLANEYYRHGVWAVCGNVKGRAH